MIKRAFTLLEVMVAIALLAIVGLVVNLKMHGAIEKKKFQSDIDRFKEKMAIAQKLAVASQTDWTGTLKKEQTGWIFLIQSEDPNSKKIKPLHIAELDILFNGKKVNKQMTFDFFSSGHTSLNGELVFSRSLHKGVLKLTDLFKREEGKKGGPEHPIMH